MFRRNEDTQPRHPVRNFVLVVVVLLGVFVATGYAMGWIDFDWTSDKASIELKTDQMKHAADKAVDGAGELMEKAGESLRDAGQSVDDES